MNVIFQLLLATMLIAVMILFRMFANRYALQSKLRSNHTDSECEQDGCFRGCVRGDEIATDNETVAE